MDILHKLASQAEQVEVVQVQGESTKVGFEANRLKSSQVEETRGIAVRVVKDGRLGFAASSDQSRMDKLASNALESAAFGDRLPIAFPPAQPGPEVVTFDPSIVELPIPRLVEIGQEILDILLQVEPEGQVYIELERGVHHLSLQNGQGTAIAFQNSPLSLSFELVRIEGDDVLWVFDVVGTTVWEDDYLASVRKAADKLELAKRSASISSGQMPVLFSPAGARTLTVPLTLGLNGKNVYKEISPMAGKIGHKLFDDKITVVDDATLSGRFASAPYDDEGIPHRRNVVIDRGVLQGFFYDLKTAAQAGAEPTGNGSRSLFSPPAPSPTNLILEAGQTPVAEMIASMDHGLLVEFPLGLGQGNVLSGAFSNTLGLAFKIEKGEIVGRVKDVSVAGNIYDLLQNVTAVSRETEWIYYNYCLPYILLPDMNVIAKE
jgi:PmbA protein